MFYINSQIKKKKFMDPSKCWDPCNFHQFPLSLKPAMYITGAGSFSQKPCVRY